MARALGPKPFITVLASPSDEEAKKWEELAFKTMGVPKEYLQGGYSSAVMADQAMERFIARRLQLATELRQTLITTMVATIQEVRKKGATPSS